MKTTENTRREFSISHTISVLEGLKDQIEDMRTKLQTEPRPELYPFRVGVLTHYRNAKRHITSLCVESTGCTKSEINALLNC
jgi:hypothetical protein